MKSFSAEETQYLKGNKFSNGVKFDMSTKLSNKPRIEHILNFVRDKNVIHFGFADHLELIQKKIDKNTWLHKILVENTKICVGIDINWKSVEFVRNELGYPNVYCLDINNDSLPSEIFEHRYDVLILGEILEHVNNPVEFLSKIHEYFGDFADFILITVPNAFDITNLRCILEQKEFINSDHRYWFTAYTLGKVLHESGFKDYKFAFSQTHFPDSLLWGTICKKFPMTRESIIACATF